MFRTLGCTLLGLVTMLSVARADKRPLVVSGDKLYSPEWIRAHTFDKTKAPSGITIYFNQCVGGCTVKPGQDDPDSNTSVLVGAATQLQEWSWKTGEWDALMQCLKEVYSPYNVNITDVRPTGTTYNEIIVAGGASAIGAPDSCGLAASIGVIGTCAPSVGAVGFAFVEDGCYQQYTGMDPGQNGANYGVCWIAAQESAHALGLDHAFGKFDDGFSTCNDPMTYQADCGGEKFFRNDFAPCNGNDGQKKAGCGGINECGTEQNPHQRLLTNVGAGTSIIPPPDVMLPAPQAGATVKAGTAVIGQAFSKRGVEHVELWINGYSWGKQMGVAFGQTGQPRGAYTINIPADVPDSILDVTMKAYDDLGIVGESPVVTVTKGKAGGCVASVTNPDGTVDTCAAGQKCTDGKCAWTDANMGMFGDACTYQQFCTGTLQCAGTATEKICTHGCDTGISDSCPMDYSCAGTGSGTAGVCFIGGGDGGGCCSVGANGLPATMMSLATLGLVLRRRKRR